MGCDGGTIPRRDELVRVKKKPEQKDKDSEREFRWLHCALTQQRLQEPIAMCAHGRLYSKQSVIERLLEKEPMPEAQQHIRSMKDIKTLQLTPNPAYNAEDDKTEGLLDTRHAPYICKLIGLEMSGKFRFVALWSCGCVLSERALKQIKSSSSSGVCPLCQTAFSVEEVIVLNGNDEDLELMKVKIEMRAAKRKTAKKDKKDKKAAAIAETVTASNGTNGVKNGGDVKLEDAPSTSKAAQTTTTTTTIKAENEKSTNVANKLKLVKRVGGAAAGSMQDPEIKRLKTDYTVAKDPKATDVYKSLFTSHKTEKEQERAHWVTYNPFYN